MRHRETRRSLKISASRITIQAPHGFIFLSLGDQDVKPRRGHPTDGGLPARVRSLGFLRVCTHPDIGKYRPAALTSQTKQAK